MRHGRRLTITIEPSANGYVARFESGFLKAVFSVEVGDNIFGAVALHSFADMILSQYGRNTATGEIEFVFADGLKPAQSKPLMDMLNQ